EPPDGLRGGEFREDSGDPCLPCQWAYRQARSSWGIDDLVLERLEPREIGRGEYRRVRIWTLLPVKRRRAQLLKGALVLDHRHKGVVLGRGHPPASDQRAAHKRGFLRDLFLRLTFLQHRLAFLVQRERFVGVGQRVGKRVYRHGHGVVSREG